MSESDRIYDLIGLGFGPANIAIAGALTEVWDTDKIKGSSDSTIKDVLFLEKHEKFQWHPGMLLPDARMQISFMKDLATLRNPQSPFTFLSYLHSQDRLVTFINRGSTVPTRKEYADYLSWAALTAQKKGVPVHFGTEVIALDDGKDGTIHVRSRNLSTGEETVRRTRDLVISPGGGARIPRALSSIQGNPRVIHSSTYTSSIGPVLDTISSPPRPLRIAVVGSGQSAAEVSIDIRERLRSVPTGSTTRPHQVELIIRKGSLKPSDDTPFSNEIFDPSVTDAWFSLPSQELRGSQLKEYRSTNYGVVNPRTIEQLYEVMYDQKVDQAIYNREKSANEAPTQPQIVFRTYSNVISSKINDDEPQMFSLILQNLFTHAITSENYDAVVCATGYQRYAWIDLLKHSSVGKHFGLGADVDSSLCMLRPSISLSVDEKKFDVIKASETPSVQSSSGNSTPPTSPSLSVGQLDHAQPVALYITRNYQLVPVAENGFKPRIYLQGVEEATHGLSDTLLSVVSVRSGEVVRDLIKGSTNHGQV